MEIRKYRIFGMAIFDLVFGVIGLTIAFLIAKHIFFPSLKTAPFVVAAILLTIPTGIIFHIIFGVNTSLNNRLGLSRAPN